MTNPALRTPNKCGEALQTAHSMKTQTWTLSFYCTWRISWVFSRLLPYYWVKTLPCVNLNLSIYTMKAVEQVLPCFFLQSLTWWRSHETSLSFTRSRKAFEIPKCTAAESAMSCSRQLNRNTCRTQLGSKLNRKDSKALQLLGSYSMYMWDLIKGKLLWTENAGRWRDCVVSWI